MITLESVGKGLRIAGEWRGAKDGTELQVIDPGKETPLAKVADAGVEDGSSAVEAALAAGPKWAAMPPRERAYHEKSVAFPMIPWASRRFTTASSVSPAP